MLLFKNSFKTTALEHRNLEFSNHSSLELKTPPRSHFVYFPKAGKCSLPPVRETSNSFLVMFVDKMSLPYNDSVELL